MRIGILFLVLVFFPVRYIYGTTWVIHLLDSTGTPIHTVLKNHHKTFIKTNIYFLIFQYYFRKYTYSTFFIFSEHCAINLLNNSYYIFSRFSPSFALLATCTIFPISYFTVHDFCCSYFLVTSSDGSGIRNFGYIRIPVTF